MTWIQWISSLDQSRKEGVYRVVIPPLLFHRYGISPLTFKDEKGVKAVRFFCPEGDRTCLVEIKPEGMDDPIYSIQLSDSMDSATLEWDFLVVNDPESPKFNIDTDREGKDTLFGWASRNIPEEERAMNAGLFPGQIRKGLGLTREVVRCLDFFCRLLNVKTIKLEALFYHNAVTYERVGFSYFDGYRQMRRIHELFQPGGELFKKLDLSTPFRRPEFAGTVRGRSWAIQDGILSGVEDDLLQEGWVSPIMYRMIEKPRAMITFPDPVY